MKKDGFIWAVRAGTVAYFLSLGILRLKKRIKSGRK